MDPGQTRIWPDSIDWSGILEAVPKYTRRKVNIHVKIKGDVLRLRGILLLGWSGRVVQGTEDLRRNTVCVRETDVGVGEDLRAGNSLLLGVDDLK
ncbi:hypothetical protein BABINDRAFT_146274 [Babjeviella inositovora NRRL Y-12698]|uniref:Uncharacterized protein n=1 Tax=Babjeviella inositovora NRRL Y-12698 TaxID=984486 RepID=A0A1E3QMQ7_9ASCO|nr:uncharacterized protein BABINDRAFT_146274 [Babjeviella inositovora NRRL Y-12698]ODQ78965.1 hypothetical protein BABINDRAFT_146274 [Babjeviella inositovora NRRL Y-12698]